MLTDAGLPKSGRGRGSWIFKSAPFPPACYCLASLRGSCQERSASGLSSSSSPIHQRGQARHVGKALASSARKARPHTGTGQPSSALVWSTCEVQRKSSYDLLATLPFGFCKFNHLGGRVHFIPPQRWSSHQRIFCRPEDDQERFAYAVMLSIILC